MSMDIKTLRVSDLRLTEVNVRKHPQKQLDELKRSYEKHGQYRPLIVTADGECIIGNGFLEMLMQNGVETVECIVLPEWTTETDKKKLLLSDNKIFELGSDSIGNIDEILQSLDDFDIPGYDEEILSQLYSTIDDVTAPTLANGEISADRIEQIKAEERKRAEAPVEDDQSKYEIKAQVLMDRQENAGRDDSYITCPHCGLKIYGYKRS